MAIARPATTSHLMPPQRSVVPDTKLSQGTGGEPVRVLLTGSSKLDDPQRDKFGYLIYRSGGKFKFGAHGVERPVHGLNVFGLVSENTGSGSWHRELPMWNGTTPSRQQVTSGCPQICDKHEELKNAEAKGRNFHYRPP